MKLQATPPANSSLISVQEITNPVELEALRSDWGRLWGKCPASTPFQTPEWGIAWWRHLGQGRLRVYAFRCEEHLVGLVPLFIYKSPESGVRQLMLIGSGNSDHLDALLEEGWKATIVLLLEERIARAGEEWDVCDLQCLGPESPLTIFGGKYLREVSLVQEMCPVLDLPHAPEDLASCIPERMWKNFRYAWRKAERTARVHASTATEANVADFLRILFDLHTARWHARQEDGVLFHSDVQRFHEQAAPDLLRQGLLRLHVLFFDERPAAACYVLQQGERACYYIGGFDPEQEKLSPGTMIVGHAICEAVRDGARQFDFLRGREGYKYHWGAVDQPAFTRKLIRHRESGS